ncbi:type VI secretion system tip protein VgrG [Rhodocytophaga rosea]|uniref:Type VI secretion system tip protein VgrG n=1 Tax=Rhodocytophaga rosea TaxID=2704465 RepID=A0A6C0GDX1_9BACT|nr:type VI secretion system tip protein VgrG [Rhodocytophaga rosea]QHT66024.1 type VI secretion system tip protein VgrG [Rhodocytophaga rosea]
MAGNQEQEGGVVSYNILTNGKVNTAGYDLMSIQVTKGINKISTAKLKIVDGGVSENQPWNQSDSKDFAPGVEIEIQAGYENNNKTIFKGIIIKHGLKITKSGDSYLSIECKDKAVKLTVGRKNKLFVKKKDSDILTEIINAYGIEKQIDATTFQHKEVIQHYCTDWDFVMMRAEINGLVAITDDGKLLVKKPDLSSEPVVSITYGVNMYDFQADMDARTQLTKVVAHAWDSDKQALVESSSKTPDELSQGSTPSSKLAQTIGLDEYLLQTTAGIKDVSVLEAWANAKHTRSYLSKIKGTVTCIGTAAIKPGTLIELSGLSSQFNGKAFVSGVTHIVEEGNWTTTAEMGLSFDWFSEETPLIDAPPASGMVAPMKGLFIAKVVKIDEDEAGEYRIQIKIPILGDNQGWWARLSTMYATNESGTFFYPEVGDEVIVGFLNEDPQYPIIMGSVHSKSSKPPFIPENTNKTKGFVTRSKLKITFDDEKKITKIETPGGNSITLNDDERNIIIEDQNKNKIEMNKEGIAITSQKDIIMKAQGKIVMEAQGNIEAKATGDAKVEGMNVAMKGSMKFAAEGAMTEVKGSGQTTIKGGIVMIN